MREDYQRYTYGLTNKELRKESEHYISRCKSDCLRNRLYSLKEDYSSDYQYKYFKDLKISTVISNPTDKNKFNQEYYSIKSNLLHDSKYPEKMYDSKYRSSVKRKSVSSSVQHKNQMHKILPNMKTSLTEGRMIDDQPRLPATSLEKSSKWSKHEVSNYSNSSQSLIHWKQSDDSILTNKNKSLLLLMDEISDHDNQNLFTNNEAEFFDDGENFELNSVDNLNSIYDQDNVEEAIIYDDIQRRNEILPQGVYIRNEHNNYVY